MYDFFNYRYLLTYLLTYSSFSFINKGILKNFLIIIEKREQDRGTLNKILNLRGKEGKS